MRRVAFLFALLPAACAGGAARAPASASAPEPREPRPGDNGYTCSAQLSGSSAVSDDEVRRLDAACTTKGEKPTAKEISECPCTQLAVALGYRKDPASRRRGIELTMNACEAGSYDACDSYELIRSLCLIEPTQPECEPLRQRALIPTEPMPLERVLGCRSSDSGILCLQRDRYYLRTPTGEWDQVAILRWHRDDSREQARWRADLAGGTLLLTPTEIVEHSLSSTPSKSVDRAYAKRCLDPRSVPFGERHGFPRDVARGTLRKLTASQQSDVRRALATLPRLEEACQQADACVAAVAKLLTPPPAPRPEPSDEGAESDEGELECAPAQHLGSLRSCQEARTQAITKLGTAQPPPACAVTR